MEAASNSGLHQCALSRAVVPDVPYLVKSHLRFANYDIVKKQIGRDFNDLKRRSSVSMAGQIDIPVILVDGTKDRVVRHKHGQRMYQQLKMTSKQVK